jgi:hypothetical protein
MKARPPRLNALGIPPPPAAAPAAPGGQVSRTAAGFPPGLDPAGRVRVSDVWPLGAAPLALAAMPGAAECAALRARVVAAEWGLGSLAVAAERVARDLAAAAVSASQGLAGEPVVRLWLHGDGTRMLVAVWDGSAEPPGRDGAGKWPFAGIAAERGWHRRGAGKSCWVVLSWRGARLTAPPVTCPEAGAMQPQQGRA